MAAAAKHFPGLGPATASQNTDSAPVTLNVSASDLRSIDEAPYGPAISAGVKLVMLSWATYPALDPNFPAGLSSTIIQNELRGRLGFTGVTITDSLTAGGLSNFGTTSQRAVVGREGRHGPAAGVRAEPQLRPERGHRPGQRAERAGSSARPPSTPHATASRACATVSADDACRRLK